MIVTMHQPNYLPWIGLFSKIKKADIFIITDIYQFGRHTVTNRNKIRTNNGWGYLTIPVSRKFQETKICDVPLPADKKWREDHYKAIYHNYVGADFFSPYRDFLEELYQRDFKYLWEINVEIILYLLKCFEIDIEVLKASEMDMDPNLEKDDLLVALSKSVGADTYLSGPSGKDYLESEKFPQNNINLKFLKFQHPVYKQRYPGFEPNMAAIDLLFNVGTKSAEIIKASGSIED